MLRRNFLKTALTLGSGVILADKLSWGDSWASQTSLPRRPYRPPLRYTGHARSGCATRPEVNNLMVSGFMALPD